MTWIEIPLMAGLCGWALASVCYAIRIRGIYPVLDRYRQFGAYAKWTMFSAPFEAGARSPVIYVEHRDCTDPGRVSAWKPIRLNPSWLWRAFFWLPELRVAIRIRRLAADIKVALEASPPEVAQMDQALARLRAYFADMKPLPAGVIREVRVVERSLGQALEAGPAVNPGQTGTFGGRERVVCSFCLGPHVR